MWGATVVICVSAGGGIEHASYHREVHIAVEKRRRVTISHKAGALVVRIARNNDRPLYMILLAAFTAGFLIFAWVFGRGLTRITSATDVLYLLPFIAFILVWYTLGLRLGLWRAFGVEEIRISNGMFQWTRTALR
jgi:drug/metabolite transporter (DMT)-like permease